MTRKHEKLTNLGIEYPPGPGVYLGRSAKIDWRRSLGAKVQQLGLRRLVSYVDRGSGDFMRCPSARAAGCSVMERLVYVWSCSAQRIPMLPILKDWKFSAPLFFSFCSS